VPVKLDPTKKSEQSEMLQWRLEGRVVGQDRAIHQFVKAMGKYYVRMHAPDRPIAVLLFLGPTGVGKTELARALAEILLNDKDALTRVDCAEFNHSHEVSKLIGSPPGYVGHGRGDTQARLSQENIDKWSLKVVKSSESSMGFVEKKPNIVLFDEIEKAHEDLFDLLLGIMDSGKLTLGNNQTTDFTRTILILTSNQGSKAVQSLTQGSDLGFHAGIAKAEDDLDHQVYKTAKDAAKKFFKPEFMNRIDRIVVFRHLQAESLKKILRIEFSKLKRRVNSGTRFIEMRMTPAAEEFILKEGTSEEYGARELKRALERYVAEPISSLIGTSQIIIGDCLTVDYLDGEMSFTKTVDPIIYKPDTNMRDILLDPPKY
jgi:ATP-dependent Clp protease ATP-binding subunit ClpB